LRPSPARAPSPELEVTLVDDAGHGGGASVTWCPGKLTGGEPGSLIPHPGLEPRVELGKFTLEAGLSVVKHAAAL
jgi:hypothetical protein